MEEELCANTQNTQNTSNTTVSACDSKGADKVAKEMLYDYARGKKCSYYLYGEKAFIAVRTLAEMMNEKPFEPITTRMRDYKGQKILLFSDIDNIETYSESIRLLNKIQPFTQDCCCYLELSQQMVDYEGYKVKNRSKMITKPVERRQWHYFTPTKPNAIEFANQFLDTQRKLNKDSVYIAPLSVIVIILAKNTPESWLELKDCNCLQRSYKVIEINDEGFN